MEPISVIIPTINRAGLLRRAIRSVIEATAPEDEIIVVDDGSTDETSSVPAEFNREIRYLPINNSGAGVARNIGIKAASHDLIAFADSDDEWLAKRLDQQRPLMQSRRDLVFSFSNFGHLFADGRVEPGWAKQWHHDERSWDEILGPGKPCSELVALSQGVVDVPVHIGSMYLRELHANYINVNTLLVRRSLAGNALIFGEKLPTYEDWECFACISRVGLCAYLDIDTALQRAHKGPRLTDADSIRASKTRLLIISRTWAADPEFVRDHGREIDALTRKLRKNLTRVHIYKGEFAEARLAAAGLGAVSFEAALLSLPTPVLGVAMKIYRAARKAGRS